MKKIYLFVVMLLLMTGCSIDNNPTSKVEALFMKYQKLDTDITNGIDSILNEQNLTDTHRERYRKLLEKQYQNLTYDIKDEVIDGDNATVTVEIKVVDYHNAISDLTFDSSLYNKESFDETKLNRLENTNDKVTYTIDLTLTKDTEGKWRLNALTNEQIKKIQGMY